MNYSLLPRQIQNYDLGHQRLTYPNLCFALKIITELVTKLWRKIYSTTFLGRVGWYE